MYIFFQSLSLALICSLGQGFLIYGALLLLLKLLPVVPSRIKYHLSLLALSTVLMWFAFTWWQQFHFLNRINEQSLVTQLPNTTYNQQQLLVLNVIEKYSNNYPIMSLLNVIFSWLSVGYFIGLTLMLLRFSYSFRQLVGLRKSGVLQPNDVYNKLLTSLKSRLHIDGNVRLLISAKAPIPMVIGFIKPIILLPVATIAQLSIAQLETILLHELAHIKRYDYLINILQTIIETILFFNPFVWLVSAIIRTEREHCCDDLVLAHTNQPLIYATALAALASQPTPVSIMFTIAATGQTHYLFSRIKRIIEMKKNPFSYSRAVAAIFIISAIICSIAWLVPSFTPSKKAKPIEATTMLPAKVQQQALAADDNETTQLVQRLIADRIVDEAQGFMVKKRQNILYINNKQLPDEIAKKYLLNIF